MCSCLRIKLACSPTVLLSLPLALFAGNAPIDPIDADDGEEDNEENASHSERLLKEVAEGGEGVGDLLAQ